MKVYAFQSIGLPQIIAEDADHNGFKATLTIPKESIFDIAKVLMVYAFHNVEQQAVQAFAQEIMSTVIDPVAVHNAAVNDPRFTEQDKQAIFEYFLQEAGDMSIKDMASILMDGADLVDCVTGACPVEFDPEDVARMLEHIGNSEEDYINGEFLRDHDDDGDNYAGMLDWSKCMKLVDDGENELTELGREFVGQHL